MPDATRATSASLARRGSHAVAVVVALLLVTTWSLTSQAADATLAGSPSLGRGGPAEQTDVAPPEWLLASQEAPGSTTRPRLSPPAWVISSRESEFWSGPDDRALLFSTLPPGTYLQPLGPYLGGRLLVLYEGDGRTRAAGQGWIDVRELGPSEPPPWVAPAPGAPALAFQSLPLQPAAPVRLRETTPPAVTARYVAIVDEASGALLYGNGQDSRVAPASTTKIATTLVALERAPDLQQRVTVSMSGSAMSARDGSSVMWLEPGDETSVETLLYGMMLPSANDAAEQIALTLGGSRERYVGWMNDKVQQLGLRNTRFANPSGMDATGHYSSAHDMALLARGAMQLPTFRKMAAAHSYYADGFDLRNANRLIGYYAGADGVKIGFTDEARKTIVASATRDGHRVYVSLMRSEDLVGDSIALFEWVWGTYQW